MNILNVIECGGIEIDASIPDLVSTVVRIIFITVPIILIFLGMIDFFKAFITNDENQIKKSQKTFINRVIMSVVIFLLPALVSLLMNMLVKDRTDLNCVSCFINGNCSGNANFSNQEESGSDVTVTSVSLKISSNSVKVGDSLTLSNEVKPSNASNKTITYESSDESVLTVTKTGTVTGVKEGSANVTATTNNGKTSSVKIVVTNDSSQVSNSDIAIESMDYELSAYDMEVGTKEQYVPIVNPTNADTSKIEYSSSKSGVATVTSEGEIVAQEEGTTTITAKAGDITAELQLNVIPEKIEIPVDSITMETAISLNVGDSKFLNPVISPNDATNKNVTYSTDNASVAIVDEAGIVTAIKEGTANIYATTESGNKVTITTVTVTQKVIKVTGLKLSKSSATVKVGATYKISATIQPSNATNKNLKYKSSNSKVAKVSSDGIITGIKKGKATITVTTEDGSKSKKVKITVEETSKIHFIPVGQGDCILLESNGKYGLLDTGKKSDYTVVSNYLKSLSITKLDIMILSHNHSDHVGSAEKLINEYKPSKLYLKKYYGNDTNSDGVYNAKSAESRMKMYNKYINAAKSVGTKIVYVDKKKDGYSITLGSMNIAFYNTTNRMTDKSEYAKNNTENINSITNLVTVNGIKTYLTADLSNDTVAESISKNIGKVTVYKLIHHGLGNGTSDNEASYVQPDYAIVTNTKKNVEDNTTFDKDIAIKRIKKYTSKIYYSGIKKVVVDYSSGKVKISR